MQGEVSNRYEGVAIEHDIQPDQERADGSTKSAQVYVRVRLVSPPEHAGREIAWYGSLKEGRAQEITAETLRVMGWKSNDIVTCDGLGDTKFVVVEKMEEYKGKTRPRYMVFSNEPKEHPTLRDEDKKDFAKRFKALAASVPAREVTEATRAPAQLPEASAKRAAASVAAPAGPSF